MKVTVGREIRINLGNFEHVVITRTITDIPSDTPGPNIDKALDKLMEGDIRKAREATAYDEESNETSVYEWNRLIGGN